jgi:hypothetical protein
MLLADLGRRLIGCLGLTKHPHNLLLRKPLLLHSISPVIVDWSYREILTLSMAQF